jgi:hypothetical protein
MYTIFSAVLRQLRKCDVMTSFGHSTPSIITPALSGDFLVEMATDREGQLYFYSLKYNLMHVAIYLPVKNY